MMLVSPKTAGGHDDTLAFPGQRDALASLHDITGARVLRDLFETWTDSPHRARFVTAAH